MTDVLGYRCPVCGGDVAFDSESQKMVCPYCDNSFEVEQLSGKDGELATQEEMKKCEWLDGEQEGMFLYNCSHCGGEIIGDDTLAATNCPYCDMPVVLKSQFRGDLKPELIIPFKLKKEDAVKKLSDFCKGKKLLPDAFTKNNRIETIRGMYVPFWLFDGTSRANNIYTGTKVSSWSDAHYHYTKTDFYSVKRAGYVEFEKVPVDGSVKMEDKYTQSIEPYNYNELVDFQTAYMAGYIADRYDVDSETAKQVAHERIATTTNQMILAQARHGYSKVKPDSENVNCEYKNAKYVLLPVWMLSTQYEGKIYTFAMNGQTGKFVGQLPIDKKKQKKYFATTTLLVTGIMSALLTLLMFI